MIQEQKIYMHDVSNNYMRRSLSRSYAFLMLNPVLFHQRSASNADNAIFYAQSRRVHT